MTEKLKTNPGELPYEQLSNPSDILKINRMMAMSSLPYPLNLVTKGHKSHCRFVHSLMVLCGSCELNYRRELSEETAKYNNMSTHDEENPNREREGRASFPPPGFINCGVQVATPILECNCGWSK